MDIATPLTSTERVIAWWRTSHHLYGSYYAMNDATTTSTPNALDALAHMILEHNFLTLPDGSRVANLAMAFNQAGITGTNIAPETVELAATYGLVELDTGKGNWQLTGNQDTHQIPDVAHDTAIVNLAEATKQLGASGATEQPSTAASGASGGGSEGGSEGVGQPAAPAPALVLTTEQHQQTRSLLQKIGDEVHHLSDDAKLAFAKLVALLHHV